MLKQIFNNYTTSPFLIHKTTKTKCKYTYVHPYLKIRSLSTAPYNIQLVLSCFAWIKFERMGLLVEWR